MEVARLFSARFFLRIQKDPDVGSSEISTYAFFLAKFHRLCVRPYKAFVSFLRRSL